MRVHELKKILELAGNEEEVVVLLTTSGSIGCRPNSKIVDAEPGMDWEMGKFILKTEDKIEVVNESLSKLIRLQKEYDELLHRFKDLKLSQDITKPLR